MMVLRIVALAALLGGMAGLPVMTAAEPDKAKAAEIAKVKKALQEVQDFIGPWNLEGTQKVGAKTEAWKEKVNWSWKFKDGDPSMTVEFEKGKYFTTGELKYLVPTKKYQLTLTGADKSEQVFVGEMSKGALKVERKDAKTADVYRLTMNTAADGIRFILKSEKQDGGKGLFSSIYEMKGNKEGESIAGSSKKPECIVTGGAATIKVSYKGTDYFVCCTGCRDEFNANPEKFVKAKK